MMGYRFVNVAFNLPINSLFTYFIPQAYQDKIKAGMRVFAPFGRRSLTGIALEFPDEKAALKQAKKIKPIMKLLDEEPILNQEMISFCKWMSKYYMSPIGETLFSAAPKGRTIESKIFYSAEEDILKMGNRLTPPQKEIVRLLSNKPMTVKQVKQKLKNRNVEKLKGVESVYSIVKTLLRNKYIKESYITTEVTAKPKFEKFVIFDHLDEFKGYTNSMLENFLKENKIRSELQADTLKYLIESGIKEVKLSELVKNANTSMNAVNSLVKKELLRTEMRQVLRRIEDAFGEDEKVVKLNTEQQDIFEKILKKLQSNEFKTFLLFGVTGSGKTQIYLETIKEVLATGKTAIVLVPEISLTPQLIYRFKNFFGDIIGVMHSKLSEGEKFDVYQRIKNEEVKIIIGTRSAIFAPLENLGIIIVDEEHDQSYKQGEKNPKYNARDSALIRGKMNNAVVILGSATPSLESFYNARAGKYTLLELPHRAKKTKQPFVEIVDMLEELKYPDKYRKFESTEKKFLSSKLIAYIDHALKNKQSIILLQNRRGYSAYLECQNCGNVKMCSNCDITMIYHKIYEQLRCHYCGLAIGLPEKCEKCGSRELKLKGTGTEKVEEEIKRLFPHAKIRRMDFDTVRHKDAHRKILKSFHDREFDILVGTQMISKGLDFPNVFLVGVVSADIGLLNPDFRASERTFQLLMQVAGRSGRMSDYGRVIVQTMHPDNYIFKYVKNHDYVSFYEQETSFRKNFDYPPFSRMTLIEVKGNDAKHVKTVASKIYLFMSHFISASPIGITAEYKNGTNPSTNSVEILKPTPALVYKIKNKFRYHIIIKALRSLKDKNSGISLREGDKEDFSHINTEKLLLNLQNLINELKLKSNEQVSVDVDPISFN